MLHLAFRVLGCADVALGASVRPIGGRRIKGRIGYTDMRRVTTGIRSEKCVVRRFRRRANVYLHKPRWYSQPTAHLRYMVQPTAPRLPTCTACYCMNTVGNCNTVVLYYNTVVYAVRR